MFSYFGQFCFDKMGDKGLALKEILTQYAREGCIDWLLTGWLPKHQQSRVASIVGRFYRKSNVKIRGVLIESEHKKKIFLGCSEQICELLEMIAFSLLKIANYTGQVTGVLLVELDPDYRSMSEGDISIHIRKL